MWLYHFVYLKRSTEAQLCKRVLTPRGHPPPILATDRYWATAHHSALTPVPTQVPSRCDVCRIPPLYSERFPTQVLISRHWYLVPTYRYCFPTWILCSHTCTSLRCGFPPRLAEMRRSVCCIVRTNSIPLNMDGRTFMSYQ